MDNNWSTQIPGIFNPAINTAMNIVQSSGNDATIPPAPDLTLDNHNKRMADDVQTLQLRAISELQQTLLGLPVSNALTSNSDDGTGNKALDDLTGLPINHIPIDVMGTITLPIIGAEAVVLTYNVPLGYDAIIKWYSINYLAAGFNDGSGDIVWRLKIDGRPVKNFDNIITQRGNLVSPRQLYDLRLYSGQVLTLTTQHIANPALNADTEGSFIGFCYPSKGN